MSDQTLVPHASSGALVAADASSLDVPDAARFGVTLAPSSPRLSGLAKLHRLLVSIDPAAETLEREASLVRLATWLRRGSKLPSLEASSHGELPPVTRLRWLVGALEAFPGLSLRIACALAITLREDSADAFLGKTGIPGDRGIFAETVDRLSRGLMPQPVDELDLTQLLERMFPSKRDARWIQILPAELVLRLTKVLSMPMSAQGVEIRDSLVSSERTMGSRPSLPMIDGSASSRAPGTWSPLRASSLDAILLLASRVSAAGLSDVIRARSPASSLRDSPFFRLPRIIDALLATRRSEVEEVEAFAEACGEAIAGCREACATVLERLETAGVSVDVVYRLELIDRSLTRIEVLLSILVPRDRLVVAERSAKLLALLLLERHRERSLLDIVGTNTHLLARKIIERAGLTGEHYITVTPGEYAKMLLSAIGGGVVMGFTTLLKFLIVKLGRPPLQEGLLASANYAGSFLVVQLIGATIATKQASMTAAAIAGTMHEGDVDREALVTTMARLLRSQIAAAMGNVIMVAVTAFCIDLWWTSRHGAPFLTEEYAHKVLGELHPGESGTVFFAAYTGLALWVSSLCAGWLENWAVYRRLPEAIAEHRIRRLVGARVTAWASRVFARNISGIGGNVSIGVILGMTTVLGRFVGIPIDVRHITLSTGQTTFALHRLGFEALFTMEAVYAFLGLACVLSLNLSVSFLLAIAVAMRARDVSFGRAMRLFGDMFVGFVRSPLRFFLPVERGAVAPRPGH